MGDVEEMTAEDVIDKMAHKGFHRPVKAFNVIRLQESWRGWIGGHPTPDPAPRSR